ncbi:MAG: alpha/beta hydrolase [bacterium]
MHTGQIVVDDKEVYYRFIGDSKSSNKILLLHGWNQVGSQSWEPLLSMFEKKDVFLVAPDMPAFGKTTEPKSVWGVDEYALFIEKFINSIDLQDSLWSLVGHSFGGAVVTQITADLGVKKISKLVLVAPAIVRESVKSQSLKTKEKVSKMGKKLLQKLKLNFLYEVSRKLWSKVIGSADYYHTTGIKSQIMAKVVRQDKQNILDQIKIPVKLIWGAEDELTPIWNADKIVSKLSDATLIKLNGVNHGVHLNAKERLFEEIDSFLL